MTVVTVSLLLAIAGTLCMIVWPLFKTRTAMLSAQLGLTTSFGLHYALEQAPTASLMNGLSALLIVASMILGTSPSATRTGYTIVSAIVAAGFLTWNGTTSLLSAVGGALNAIGRVQANASALRIVTLTGTPFWLMHDIAISSPLMIADALSLLMGGIAVFRESRFGATPRLSAGPRSYSYFRNCRGGTPSSSK